LVPLPPETPLDAHTSVHLAYARQNGVTDDELQEALLHLAFYAGWPNGMGATGVLKNIVENES
jgi:4-carboxymuconolactone decarboxylase